jgi:hypothetical protein
MKVEHKVAAAFGDDLDVITVICTCGYKSDDSGIGGKYDMPAHIVAKNRDSEAAT